MKTDQHYKNTTVTFRPECDSDKLILTVIVNLVEELCVVTGVADGRVKNAQRKMHESTTVLAEFISNYKPNKSLISRMALWLKGARIW